MEKQIESLKQNGISSGKGNYCSECGREARKHELINGLCKSYDYQEREVAQE